MPRRALGPGAVHVAFRVPLALSRAGDAFSPFFFLRVRRPPGFGRAHRQACQCATPPGRQCAGVPVCQPARTPRHTAGVPVRPPATPHTADPPR